VYEILQLLFPVSCLVCDSPGTQLCTFCHRAIGPAIRYREFGGIKYWAGADYGVELAKVILLAKEQNNSPAREFLADLIVQTFLAASMEFNIKNSLFIPIPSSRAANRTRGFRHALLLARVAAKKIQKIGAAAIEVRELLQVNRPIADQSNLNRSERIRNLSGAYSVKNRTKDRDFEPGLRSIFLIDDLVTTGSSTREGLRALHGSGFVPHGVLSAGVSPEVSMGAFS
jgi:predicted amidophosphoribosyltransferase